MYVAVIVDEDGDEDDKGGQCSLGKDGDNAHDRCGSRQGGASIDAGRGAGGGAVGRALFCRLCVLTWSPGGEGCLLDGPDYLVPQLVPPPPLDT